MVPVPQVIGLGERSLVKAEPAPQRLKSGERERLAVKHINCPNVPLPGPKAALGAQ